MKKEHLDTRAATDLIPDSIKDYPVWYAFCYYFDMRVLGNSTRDRLIIIGLIQLIDALEKHGWPRDLEKYLLGLDKRFAAKIYDWASGSFGKIALDQGIVNHIVDAPITAMWIKVCDAEKKPEDIASNQPLLAFRRAAIRALPHARLYALRFADANPDKFRTRLAIGAADYRLFCTRTFSPTNNQLVQMRSILGTINNDLKPAQHVIQAAGKVSQAFKAETKICSYAEQIVDYFGNARPIPVRNAKARREEFEGAIKIDVLAGFSPNPDFTPVDLTSLGTYSDIVHEPVLPDYQPPEVMHTPHSLSDEDIANGTYMSPCRSQIGSLRESQDLTPAPHSRLALDPLEIKHLLNQLELNAKGKKEGASRTNGEPPKEAWLQMYTFVELMFLTGWSPIDLLSIHGGDVDDTTTLQYRYRTESECNRYAGMMTLTWLNPKTKAQIERPLYLRDATRNYVFHRHSSKCSVFDRLTIKNINATLVNQIPGLAAWQNKNIIAAIELAARRMLQDTIPYHHLYQYTRGNVEGARICGLYASLTQQQFEVYALAASKELYNLRGWNAGRHQLPKRGPTGPSQGSRKAQNPEILARAFGLRYWTGEQLLEGPNGVTPLVLKVWKELNLAFACALQCNLSGRHRQNFEYPVIWTFSDFLLVAADKITIRGTEQRMVNASKWVVDLHQILATFKVHFWRAEQAPEIDFSTYKEWMLRLFGLPEDTQGYDCDVIRHTMINALVNQGCPSILVLGQAGHNANGTSQTYEDSFFSVAEQAQEVTRYINQILGGPNEYKPTSNEIVRFS